MSAAAPSAASAQAALHQAPMGVPATTASSASGAVPVRIGQYRLSKTLGIGSFGKVKRAFLSLSLSCARASLSLSIWMRRARISQLKRAQHDHDITCLLLRTAQLLRTIALATRWP